MAPLVRASIRSALLTIVWNFTSAPASRNSPFSMPMTMGTCPYQVHDAPKSTLAAGLAEAPSATDHATSSPTSAMIRGFMTSLLAHASDPADRTDAGRRGSRD